LYSFKQKYNTEIDHKISEISKLVKTYRWLKSEWGAHKFRILKQSLVPTYYTQTV